MGCLDENTLVALVEGTLDAGTRQSSVRHLDDCSTCRATVGSLVHLGGSHANDSGSSEAGESAALAATVASERPPAPAQGEERGRGGFFSGQLVAQRFQLDRVVGEGGLGVVWAATHLVTRKAVALKILKFSHPELNRRFVREARVAGALQHPNVVQVHDVFSSREPDGPLVMVMDLLSGESLDAHLERVGRLSPGSMLRTLHPVWSALVAAHTLGIVHRDLKPQNIFLAQLSNEVRPMLLDFGLAKLTATEGAAAATSVLTREKAIMGTPMYMAPEQLYGETQLDARTDVWAAGAVMYECLTGKRPLEGVTVGQLMKSLATREIPSIGSLAPGVPAELAAAIDAMLRRDRDERPNQLEPFLQLSAQLVARGLA
jgi:serine/threonine-protein kinase